MIGRRASVLACFLVPAFVHCGEPAAPRSCADAVSPITDGFGAPGSHAFLEHAFSNPDWPAQPVWVRLPEGAPGPVPVILFAHAYDTAKPEAYAGLLAHWTSRGFAVVFPSYVSGSGTHEERYAALWSGFAEAARRFRPHLDLAHLGIVGHSYGAGATPFLAHHALVEQGWGGDGAFLVAMAPWYPLRATAEQMAALPAHLQALVLVFEDDGVNDHRIAIDLFHALPLPQSEKDYVLLRSDAHGPCALRAVHSVPQSHGLAARDDALDSHGVFRLVDALAASAFTGDADGRRVALGDGAPEQVTMGRWWDGTPVRPLQVLRDPTPVAAQSAYLFRYDDAAAWARYGPVAPE